MLFRKTVFSNFRKHHVHTPQMNKRNNITVFLLAVAFSMIFVPFYNSVPLAYATSPTLIEQGYSIQINYMIKLAEAKAKLAELKANPYSSGIPLWGGFWKYQYDREVSILERDILWYEDRLAKIKTAIAGYIADPFANTLASTINNTDGLDNIIEFSQAAALLYIHLISGIIDVLAGGALSAELLIEMLEVAKKGAESVGDEDAADEIQELLYVGQAVIDAEETLEDFKKKIKDYRDALQKAEEVTDEVLENISYLPNGDNTLVLASNR